MLTMLKMLKMLKMLSMLAMLSMLSMLTILILLVISKFFYCNAEYVGSVEIVGTVVKHSWAISDIR